MLLLGQGVQDRRAPGPPTAPVAPRPRRAARLAGGAAIVVAVFALGAQLASPQPTPPAAGPAAAPIAPGPGEVEAAPPPAAPVENPPASVPITPDGPCVQDQLSLRVDGWDSAMGTSAARLVVTNRGSTRCHLDGYPSVRLLRGAEDLWLMTDRAPTPRPTRVRIAPGASAIAPLVWKGYRQQADEASPQTLVVRARGGVATDGEPYARSTLQVRLTGPRIDLVEGAPLTVGAWRPATTTDSP